MADPFDEGPSKAAPAPPKKKSLFSNSSWSKPQEPEDGIEFFSRAKELYPIRVAEEERKRKKKVAKQKQERKRSTASAERKDSTTPELKRRRLSSEAVGGENSSDNSPSNQLLNDAFSSHSKLAYDTLPTDCVSRTRSPGSPVTQSARYSKGLNTKPEAAAKQKPISENYIALSDSEDVGRVVKSGAGQAIILLDDDDDDDIYAAERIISQFEEEDPQMSDEEFPELVQRARERERQKEQERLNTAMAFAGKNHVNELTVSAVDDVFQDINTPEVDPIVEILVTSYMEGTNPLLVRRRLNQRLKEVRLSWCDKQLLQGVPLPPQLRASVFLTWNGKRLFDASTCKHLGVKLGTDGKFSTEGDGFDDNGRLHFEAWTEDLFIAYQRQNQLQQDGVENEPESEPAQEPSGRIKLLLKARDMEPFRLRVKPTTSVEKMAIAFRTDKNIPKEKEIALYFDGDRLDPALRVADSELDDMDTIEVHIR